MQAEDYIKNGDFKQGKMRWIDDGRVVFLSENGEELNQEQDGYIPVLKISLNSTKYSQISQQLKHQANISFMNVFVELKPGSNYAKSQNINALSDTDWAPGDSWRAWIGVPKTRNDITTMAQGIKGGFIFQSKNFSESNWHTIVFKLQSLESKNAEKTLIISFPPGDGEIYIKRIWTE